MNAASALMPVEHKDTTSAGSKSPFPSLRIGSVFSLNDAKDLFVSLLADESNNVCNELRSLVYCMEDSKFLRKVLMYPSGKSTGVAFITTNVEATFITGRSITSDLITTLVTHGYMADISGVKLLKAIYDATTYVECDDKISDFCFIPIYFLNEVIKDTGVSVAALRALSAKELVDILIELYTEVMKTYIDFGTTMYGGRARAIDYCLGPIDLTNAIDLARRVGIDVLIGTFRNKVFFDKNGDTRKCILKYEEVENTFDMAGVPIEEMYRVGLTSKTLDTYFNLRVNGIFNSSHSDEFVYNNISSYAKLVDNVGLDEAKRIIAKDEDASYGYVKAVNMFIKNGYPTDELLAEDFDVTQTKKLRNKYSK